MAVYAYDEVYLSDAQSSLGLAFDYAVNDCGVDLDLFAQLFAASTSGKLFEQGDPRVISGMSGVELAITQLERLEYLGELPEPTFGVGKTPEYWAGWVLAFYQWRAGLRFRDVLREVPASRVVELYPMYHEVDVCRAVEQIDRWMRYEDDAAPTNLRAIRESRGVSQAQLAELSGVNVRSIQMYEQRSNDVNKAQAITLFRLAAVLGCEIEDLLELPALGERV